MRILFLGNNWLGWKVLQWLVSQNEHIVGLVLHPDDQQKFGKEILSTIELSEPHVFDGSRLREPLVLDAIRSLEPDIGISILYGYILKTDFLDIFPRGCINLHPAYLPYNRGAYPNVWSIIDGTPAGTTLHYIDAGIDTGEIIAQMEVPVEPVDTGKTLYEKLEQASLQLFIETWPALKQQNVETTEQSGGRGTYHQVRDIELLDEIQLDQDYKALDMINLIRARTFPPYNGAYFKADGRKIFLRLSLEFDDSLSEKNDDEQ